MTELGVKALSEAEIDIFLFQNFILIVWIVSCIVWSDPE
jgi:hypothetical protein